MTGKDPGPESGESRTISALSAADLIRTGRIYDLGTDYGRDMPQGSSDTFHPFEVLQYRLPKTLVSRESKPFDFSMDVIIGSPHLGTHMDGPAHISSRGQLFGGHDIRDVYGDFGWRANGMETSTPIVSRGILIDVAGHRGVQHLADRYEITPDDLERTLEAQGTDLRHGDAVLVRTGWFSANYRTDGAAYFASQPGVGPDGAIWLYERGMALLGTDTSGTEVVPMPDPERTTHLVMLVERGIPLIEIMDLDAIAHDQAFEFAFIGLPLKITGATGSWLRPIAVV